MTIQQILKSWGILLPEENNISSYFPEYLLQNYPSKCYFADFFPEIITSKFAYKYDQIESKIYNLIYERIYNVILKLWVYDNLYFESELLHAKKFFNPTFLFNSIKRQKVLNNINTNCIENEKHLRTLLKLNRKNIIDLVFAFEEFHLLIVPSWSCFFVFVEDDSMLHLISDIFNTEGLHMRERKTEG